MLIGRNFQISKLLFNMSLKYKRQYTAIPVESAKKNVEEIQIPTPWGHIAGKWYNRPAINDSTPTLLFLHGWLDNCGSFDRLIELLPPQISYLCIDFPGHGNSSWIPPGMHYHAIDFVAVINLIMRANKWKKISIAGHSLGSLIAFIFSSLYPDKVKMLIALDPIKPISNPNQIAKEMEYFYVIDERNRLSKSEPPCYTIDELRDLYHAATFSSVKREFAHHIFERNVAQSKEQSEKYYFKRDNRVKLYHVFQHSNEYFIEMAKRITAPKLMFRALQEQNPVYKEAKDNFEPIISGFDGNIEYYNIRGTHHVHLNDPEKLISKLNPFILETHFA